MLSEFLEAQWLPSFHQWHACNPQERQCVYLLPRDNLTFSIKTPLRDLEALCSDPADPGTSPASSLLLSCRCWCWSNRREWSSASLDALSSVWFARSHPIAPCGTHGPHNPFVVFREMTCDWSYGSGILKLFGARDQLHWRRFSKDPLIIFTMIENMLSTTCNPSCHRNYLHFKLFNLNTSDTAVSYKLTVTTYTWILEQGRFQSNYILPHWISHFQVTNLSASRKWTWWTY